MSHTDSHRPEWVRCNDYRREVTISHSQRCHRTGGAACDLPQWPVDKHHNETSCRYHPTAELSLRIYRGSYVTTRSRRPFRRAWFDSERTAQRMILRGLTRDAMHGCAVDDDVIDNRQTHRHTEYGGGWWD
ncbi:hypothetical protein [Mycolicibacterium sp. CBMA 226]|uniref:hypothetical protein n=1 Tax=Mycolicibacterium sp. CBMA 226 TaxID=2606611 RepID=UPI0012DCD665|nr:hypothetical protein [Mycolicibacterium sp. CBMA 226]MUL78786.1 hypothetical protein [Mycolicibacterium sp. CBMA 226]QGW61078.1 hypothetical protein ICEMyc226_00046 [Mycolicibacterium sp.]